MSANDDGAIAIIPETVATVAATAATIQPATGTSHVVAATTPETAATAPAMDIAVPTPPPISAVIAQPVLSPWVTGLVVNDTTSTTRLSFEQAVYLTLRQIFWHLHVQHDNLGTIQPALRRPNLFLRQ